ncbi:MAG TPA: hypothetical protein VF765_21510 [Polyangiaceae bacterium]
MVRPAFLAACIACATVSAQRPARADTKAECVAAADQGQSLRDDGKYRRAREAFATCSRDVCPKVVVQSCSQWMHDLDAAMPTVVLGAKDDQGNDVATAHVTVDGQPLTETLDGKPVAIDPGMHALRFEHPGSQPAEADVVIRAGEKNREVGVTLHALASATDAHPPPQASPAPNPESTHGTSFFTARNTTALVLVVAGIGAIAGGAYFVSQSSSESNTASSLRNQLGPSDACTVNPSNSLCGSLKTAVDSQHTDTAAGAILLAAGGAAVVGGVVAWLVWPKSEPSEPASTPEVSFGPGRITLGVSGSF